MPPTDMSAYFVVVYDCACIGRLLLDRAANRMEEMRDTERRQSQTVISLQMEKEEGKGWGRSTEGGAPSANGSIASQFFCPITYDVMVDPVVALDGFTSVVLSCIVLTCVCP